MNATNTTKQKSKPTANRPAKPNTATQSRWRKPLTIIGWIVGIYIASLFVPFINAYTAYPLAILKCGGKPVIANKFMASYTYRTPENKLYAVSFTDNPWLYYCSVEDAQRAGYRPGLGEPDS